MHPRPEGQGPSSTFNSQSTFVLPFEDAPAAMRRQHERTAAAVAGASPGKVDPNDAAAVVALWMGDRWNPDRKVVPGGEHNATYVWLNLVAGGDTDLSMEWVDEIIPGRTVY